MSHRVTQLLAHSFDSFREGANPAFFDEPVSRKVPRVWMNAQLRRAPRTPISFKALGPEGKDDNGKRRNNHD